MQITTPSQRAAGEWYLRETLGDQIAKLGDISGWAQTPTYGATMPAPAMPNFSIAPNPEPLFPVREGLIGNVDDIRGQISGLLAQPQAQPTMPDLPQMNVEQAGLARLGALLAQMLGARSQVARSGVGMFDAGQADIQNRNYAQMAQRAQGTANAENLQNQAWLDQLKFDLASASGKLTDFDNQMAFNEDVRQFNTKNDTELEKIKGLNDRAKGTWENRLANTKLTNEGRIALEKLKIDNPQKIAEIKDMADYLEGKFGKESADAFVKSQAEEQSILNKKNLAQADNATESANDKRTFRNPKLQEFKDKHLKAEADVRSSDATTAKRYAEIEKILRTADDLDLTESEIQDITDAFSQYENEDAKAINRIQLRIDEAKKILAQYEPGEDGYDKAAQEVLMYQDSLDLMKRSQKEYADKKKEELANAKKGKASAPKGGYTRIRTSARSKGDFDSGKISANLLNDLQSAGDALNLNVTIGTAMTGHSPRTRSGNKSRHSVGHAVDITHINGHSVSSPTGRKLADQLVAKLVASGAKRNSESGNQRAVLWQMQDHYDHIHYSNKG